MAAKPARSQRAARSEPLLKVGDLLAGKYRVERILGEGGMGVVVAAHHELLDQRVAVKLLYQDIADREAASRLLQEARAAAKVQSDHVARVVDADMGPRGLPFIVMELLEGIDLCQMADRCGALPRWLVVDYMLQALEGLAHAHARGIVHRDLKPSNLFLADRPDGTQIIKILDFGISKTSSGGERSITMPRSLLGSPPYMSPEQIRAPKTIDHRTDIWSLGVSMYELLTASMPFGGQEIQETFAAVLETEPTPVRALVNGVPEGLEEVVMRCLAKKREDRYPDVGELAKALMPFGSGSFMQSAERVAATLARGIDDASTGAARLRIATPTAVDVVPIPVAPAMRRDSLQPELNGTARTLERRFSVLEPGKLWMVGVATACAFLGVALIIVTAARARHRATDHAPEPSVASPLSTLDEPAAPATVLGASPVAPPPAAAAPPSATAAKIALAPAPSASAPPRSPRRAAAPPSSHTSLPAGLPGTRSGH